MNGGSLQNYELELSSTSGTYSWSNVYAGPQLTTNVPVRLPAPPPPQHTHTDRC